MTLSVSGQGNGISENFFYFFLFEEARSTLIPFLSFMIPENKNPLVFVLLETTSSVFVGSDQRYFFQAAINVRSAL